MIPRRIKLRNFLSYRECEVDLSGLHIAVLTGKNGEGKSALLDAMTWAVWGAARGTIEDDRIRLHAGEMLVDFEFEAHGDLFQVIRKRTRGRAVGEVHFFQLDPAGGKTTLTGATVRETQAEIIRRVRTDYDTFASSAFVAQGHADEFTKKKPAERKEVFRKVLGLQLYEELSASAADRKKQAAAETRAIGLRLGDAEAEVQELPAVEEQLACIAREACAIGPKRSLLEDTTAELRRLQADFRRTAEEAQATRERAARSDQALRTARALFHQAKLDVASAQALVAKGGDVRARHETFTGLRERERTLAAVQEQATAIADRIRDAGQQIASEEMRLRTLAGGLERDVERLETASSELSALQEARAGFEREAAAIAGASLAIESDRARLAALQDERSRADTERESCQKQGKELQERRKQLTAADGAPCPVCRRPLSPLDREHVDQEYRSQIRDLRERMEAAKTRVLEASCTITALDAGIAAAVAASHQRDTDLQRHQRDYHVRLSLATDAAAALPERKADLAAALAVLAAGDFAHEARRAHCAAREELAALGYEVEAHRRLRSELQTLEGVETELRRIVAAEERAVSLERERDQLEAALDERERDFAESAATAEAACAMLAAAEDVEPRLRAHEEELVALRAAETELAVRQGRMQERRAKLQDLVARVEVAREDVQAHREAEGTYGELAKAFGRDGVQAMLIEQSLPRVEQVANEMLDRMTGGRINVALATQKQTASGNTRETLDIRISDELGTRDYEMYSGGEAFRVDFALRIALARLLAERAGAELPTLIIDEGFGSQDQEGIDRLVESIQAIRDDFKLILVVTHVEELRERFERRIEVTKDPERGSMARVV